MLKVLLIFLIFICSSFEARANYEPIEISDEKINLSFEIYKKLKKDHFYKITNPTKLNDDFIEGLISELDENKRYFLKQEVEAFEIKNAQYDKKSFNIELAFEVINLYQQRLYEISEFQIRYIASSDIDIFDDETLDIYKDDNEWLNSKDDLLINWRKLTENDLIQEILANNTHDAAVENLTKRYKNRIKRINQQKEEDIFSIATNTFTNQFDPHSSYLSPRNSENFDMNMSLKLEGIGALLGADDDFTKIVSLVAGGPAEKSGKISPDDKIVKIKQEDESDFIDVSGWRIDDVVNLIRGPSGSEVKIEFISSNETGDSERKIVSLIREEIKLEDRAAKYSIFEHDNKKLGVIELPSFYMDFNAYLNGDKDYKSSSNDVRKILEEFNSKNVEGLVLDLRNNGGGALDEANKIISLFIERGPTVQVKLSTGYVRPFGSMRNSQVWEKPLIVLVNRYSASASEIVAAAIKDYQRGLIVGSRTFGKGTVQRLDELTSGSIKVTESKYYRINGGSVQNKGVMPHIVLPTTWDIESVGESSYPTSLPWDTIKPFKYKPFEINLSKINSIYKNYKIRENSEPNLQFLLKAKERYDLNKNKKIISLNLDDRKTQKELREKWVLDNENQRRQNLGLELFKSKNEYDDYMDEAASNAEIKLETDFVLNESINILVDYINFDTNTYLAEAIQ